MEHQRRSFSYEEKVKILREHLTEKVPISQVCEASDAAQSFLHLDEYERLLRK